MKFKKMGRVLLALLMGMCLMACSRAKEPESTGKEKIVIWAWDESFNIKAVNEAKEIFVGSNPQIEVEIVTMTQDDVISKLNTGLSSGDYTGLPDIVLIEDYRIQAYLKEYKKDFADLSDIASADDFATYKTCVNQIDGRLYGIPFDSGVAVLFYRIDFIEAAGYTQKDMENLTWGKYIEIGKAVKEKAGKYMLTLNPNDLGQIRMMLQSAGSWYTDEDGKVNIKDNQALKDAIITYQKVFDSGISKQVADWSQFVSAFQESEVATVPTGCWISPSIMASKEQSGKWAVASFPRMEQNPNSVNASSIGGGAWYVLKSAGNEEIAKRFLKETFAANIGLLGKLADEIHLVSTLKAVKVVDNYTNGIEFYNGQAVGHDLLTWQNDIPMVNYGDDTYKIEEGMTEAIQRVLEGEAIDKVLEEYHKKMAEETE
uniref:ABC transporter substrate-binding protein n=1 Tax=Agathobacter sp. TaxID=2021311 RepID=UPI00405737A4